MSSIHRQQASRLRQDMKNLMVRMECLIQEMSGRDSLVKGTLYQRRCCGSGASGRLRRLRAFNQAFSYSKGGKTKHVALSRVDHKRLEPCVQSYRRFRAARAQLCKRWGKLLEFVDEMESLRRIPVEQLMSSVPHHVRRKHS